MPPTASPTRRAPRKARASLTRSSILAAAEHVLRRDGSDFSVRRLGAELGADPSAIYWHFDGKDALLLALAEQMHQEAMAGFELTGDWVRDLREMGMRTYQSFTAHPDLARLVAHRVTGVPREMESVDTILGLLHGAGLPRDRAVVVYRALVRTVHSFAVMNAQRATQSDDDRAADADTWVVRYGLADPAIYPNVAASASALAQQADPAPEFTALNLMLAGIAAEITKGDS